MLRGIGIAAILARIYDIILDERFRKWYTPNREQAGFCAGRGCPFPLFSIFLLLHYSIQNNKEFCIGFMDYEKAFDFANRAKIVTKLMEKGCGKTFTEAITKMFHSTNYAKKSKRHMVLLRDETALQIYTHLQYLTWLPVQEHWNRKISSTLTAWLNSLMTQPCLPKG